MEDYDSFVQHRLFELRKSEEEHNKHTPASSLIRFYGQPILPPLLSPEQKEEMQQHRDAAQKAAANRKLKDDGRMAHVQTTLHSVQLRKTPTLEEFLHELETNIKSSHSHNTCGRTVSQSNYIIGTSTSNGFSLLPDRKENKGTPPPLTSTTFCAFSTSKVKPQQSYQEGCLISQHGLQLSSLNGAIHQSVSSGYVTYENVKTATCVSRGTDARGESHDFGCSQGAYNGSDFFLHSTSNTVAKMPDIISHPPIDGEELEKSGLELSFCNNFVVGKDIYFSSLQNDSIICDHSPVEKSKSSLVYNTEGEDNCPITMAGDLNKDDILKMNKDPVASTENTDFAHGLELSKTLNTYCPVAELHIQHNHTESANSHVDEAEPSEEPYRLSLQALLKKSQEYRRCQRMLRNQARNTKIQERTQEQPRARREEQSLSDKENDEIPYKGTGTAERKKTKEKRSSFIPTGQTSPKISWKKQRKIESEFFDRMPNKYARTRLTENKSTRKMAIVEDETIFKQDELNISQELLTEHKQTNAFPQQQLTSTETSTVDEAFYLTVFPTAFQEEVGKQYTIPAPKFCKSPVHCKSKGRIQDGEAAYGAETSKRKVLVNTGWNEDLSVEEVNLEHQNTHISVPSPVNLMVSTKSSQHTDQLKYNLSGLKVLISDLERGQTEHLGNHSQLESNTQSEFSYDNFKLTEKIKDKKLKQLCESDGNHWKDKLRGHDDTSCAEPTQKYREWQRQSLDNSKNMLEDTGSEPSIGDTDDVPLLVQVKGTETVHLSELRLVKTSAREKAKDDGTYIEGLRKSCGLYGIDGKKQRPSTKCILSEAQRLRIPDVFRNVQSETTGLHDASVLSETSCHPVDEGKVTAVEDNDSTHLLNQCSSLNQSYDVDAPSGLWLLEGLGSDLGTKGHPFQEQHLTPESGGEGQGGISRAKQRLLMHITEETQDMSADGSRGMESVTRPSSSTPRAKLQQFEGHSSQRDKHEQLKQAHAAQLRALQEEHRRQQEELLQALTVCCSQSMSFPCLMSSSRLGDMLAFSSLSQPSNPLSERYHPLLLAAVKGFLTRRLLKTEKVAQLVRTIRDTQQFLQALQQQSSCRGQFCNRQDLLLQDRLTLQLRAARYEVNDIFFSLSAGERMQLISWDRELTRERELRQQSGHGGQPRRKTSLSAATQKSLERKRRIMIQKKAVGKHQGVLTGTGCNTGFSAEQLPETK